MVSLFGLKLGGDKKKKPEKSDAPPSRRGRAFSRSAKDAPAMDEDIPAVPKGIFSSSRPGSSQSFKLFSRKSKFSPYGSGTDGALSMANLPRPAAPDDSPLPSPAFLRPTTSNPNLNSWKRGSTTSLAAPTHPPAPLDVLTRSISGPVSGSLSVPTTTITTTTSVTSPKSPLGTYELTLDLPSERLSIFGDYDAMLKPPEPLRVKKQSPTSSTFSEAKIQASKPPSPPLSAQTSTPDDVSILERSSKIDQGSLARPLGRMGSNQTFNSRKDLESLESPIDPVVSDRFALPTPPMSVARNSEDRPATGSSNQWGEPIIQNVRGKRDTMIVKPTRRMSFEKYVEDFSRGLLPLSDDVAPEIPAMSSKRTARPAPLNLSVRNDLVVQPALQSAPLGLSQRPLLAQSETYRRPGPAPPLSAGASYSRRAHQQYTSNISKPSTDDYGCFHINDDLDEDRPPTPDSPLLPLSGPLASPLPRPDVKEEPEDPLERMRNFRFPAVKPDDNSRVPRYRSASSVRESLQTAEWPLPSPVQPPKDIGSLSPRLSGAQIEAQVRSFSRPWTPRKDTELLSLHDSPDSLGSSVAHQHIASQVMGSAPIAQVRNPVVNDFDGKGGFF